MSMAYIGIALAVGTAVYGYAKSSDQKKKGERERKSVEAKQFTLDAKYQLPEELAQNKQQAELRSKTGIPAEQYAIAQKAIARNQSKTLKSAGDRRMGLGLLASIDDNANRAQGNLDAKNAQARLDNERNLVNINNNVANWKTAKLNKDYARLDNEKDYANAVIGSANQNKVNAVMSGINAAGMIAGAAYKGGGNSTWASGLFGGRRGTGAGTGSVGDANGGNLRLNEAGFLIDANGNVVN